MDGLILARMCEKVFKRVEGDMLRTPEHLSKTASNVMIGCV